MTRHRLTAVLAIAGLLGCFPRAATASDVRASLLCTTLHTAVQPSLAELMKNDALLEAANRALAQIFNDQAAGATASGDNGRFFLRNVAVALTHNLDSISQLLGHAFPQDANATTFASEELMKSRLQAVLEAQNDALNLIEGYVQTEDMGRARDEFPGGYQPGATFHNSHDPAQAVPMSRERAGNPATLLQVTRSRISSLEEPAGTAIMSALQTCNSR